MKIGVRNKKIKKRAVVYKGPMILKVNVISLFSFRSLLKILDHCGMVEKFSFQLEDWAYACIASKSCYSEKSQAYSHIINIAIVSLKYANYNTAHSILQALG